MSECWRNIGQPVDGGIMIVADHASADLPEGVDLGVSSDILAQHVGHDIGVTELAELLARRFGFFGILGRYSRLLVDLNRDVDDPAVIPEVSDGIAIPANRLDDGQRKERLARYHHPFHFEVERQVGLYRPKFILFLHSFTPSLSTAPGDKRPWDVALLYDRDRRASDLAMRYFAELGLVVGDQEPYSGEIYNATFARHGEETDTAHILLEVRQDHISTATGQDKFADMIGTICRKIADELA